MGGAEIILTLDDPTVDNNTVNVIPRHLHSGPGSFGSSQAAFYWTMAADRLTVRALAPQGIPARDLAFSVVYQSTTGIPAFALDTPATRIYDVDGGEIAVTPSLTVHP